LPEYAISTGMLSSQMQMHVQEGASQHQQAQTAVLRVLSHLMYKKGLKCHSALKGLS
jgi:hypothetical protein